MPEVIESEDESCKDKLDANDPWSEEFWEDESDEHLESDDSWEWEWDCWNEWQDF